MSLNKLDKEKIIDIIDFIITEDGCDPETFNEYMNDSYNGIEEFFNKIYAYKNSVGGHFPKQHLTTSQINSGRI